MKVGKSGVFIRWYGVYIGCGFRKIILDIFVSWGMLGYEEAH